MILRKEDEVKRSSLFKLEQLKSVKLGNNHQRENDRKKRAQVQSQETTEQHEPRLFFQRQQDRAKRTRLKKLLYIINALHF